MYKVSRPAPATHGQIALAMNSGPFSERVCAGTPRSRTTPACAAVTAFFGDLLRHLLVEGQFGDEAPEALSASSSLRLQRTLGAVATPLRPSALYVISGPIPPLFRKRASGRSEAIRIRNLVFL